VDDIKIEGDNILVARRPQEFYMNDQGFSVYRMLPICEYWLIDTKKDTVLKVDNTNVVHCN
jgi:hypothetical protein